MTRAVTRANSVLVRNDLRVLDVGIIAELTATSMSLVSAGKWKASDKLASAVYRTALIKGFTPDEAAAIRDEYIALCDEAYLERNGKAVVR